MTAQWSDLQGTGLRVHDHNPEGFKLKIPALNALVFSFPLCIRVLSLVCDPVKMRRCRRPTTEEILHEWECCIHRFPLWCQWGPILFFV